MNIVRLAFLREDNCYCEGEGKVVLERLMSRIHIDA
ncbi:hypothetical protein AK812_SmicGene47515, partial [Symbiodinium microadriaticum]